MHPSEAVETHKNVCSGAALERGYASRASADGCMQLNGCVVGSGAAVEGAVHGRSGGNP